MREAPDSHPRISSRGWRLPPKAFGNNRGQEEMNFRHNGRTTERVHVAPPLAQLHKTYSVYIYNATLWTVDYDATELRVHNGDEASGESGYSSASEDHEESEFRDDWVSMSFFHMPNMISSAGRRREHWRLCTERTDQHWVSQSQSWLQKVSPLQAPDHLDHIMC